MPPFFCCKETICADPYLESTPPEDLYFVDYEPAGEWVQETGNPCCWRKTFNYVGNDISYSFQPLAGWEFNWSIDKVILQDKASKHRIGFFAPTITTEDVCWEAVGEIGTAEYVHNSYYNIRGGWAYKPAYIIVRYSRQTVGDVPKHCFSSSLTYYIAYVQQSQMWTSTVVTFTMSPESCFEERLPNVIDSSGFQFNTYTEDFDDSIFTGLPMAIRCFKQCFDELPSSILLDETTELIGFGLPECSCNGTITGLHCIGPLNMQDTPIMQAAINVVEPILSNVSIDMCDNFLYCSGTGTRDIQWYNCATKTTQWAYGVPKVSCPSKIVQALAHPGGGGSALGNPNGLQPYLISDVIRSVFNTIAASGVPGKWLVNSLQFFWLNTAAGANSIANCNTEEFECGVDYLGNPIVIIWGGSFYRGANFTDLLWEKEIFVNSNQTVCFRPPSITGLVT